MYSPLSFTEEQNGNPLTNYYQLSLDVLALCLFNGTYSPKKVADLFAPENKNFYFHDQFSVGELLNPILLVHRTWSPVVTLPLRIFPPKLLRFFFTILYALILSEENFLWWNNE
jgi:hypothetical protein